MSWPARLWFVGAWWLAPAMVVLGFYYVSSQGLDAYTQPVSAAVDAAEATGLTFALAGAAAALVGARLRASGALACPSGRHALSALVDALLPLYTTAGMVTVATIAWTQSREQAVGWPGLGVLTVYGSILLAVLCWGLALGTWLRGWISTPAALIGTFLVLGFPPAMYPLWLRHMFGISGCCGIDQSLDGRVVWAATLVAVGSSAAALLAAFASPAVAGRRVTPAAALATAAAVQSAALGLGATFVSGLTSEAATERLGQPVCAPIGAGSTGPRLCLWPEHERARAAYSPILAAVSKVEERAGLTPTRVFTEKGTRDDPTVATVYARPSWSVSRMAESVVSALAAEGACLDPQGNELTPGPATWDIPAQLTLNQWWAQQLSAELAVSLRAEPIPAADDLLRGLPPTQQHAWLDAVTAARRTCRPSFPPGAAR